MGVITLALIASGHWTDTSAVPLWVKVVVRRGDRARHLHRRLADHPDARQGSGRDHLAPGDGGGELRPRQSSWSSSHLGFALSTTQVATGSILGSGVGKPGATVRWGVAGRMVMAWLITMPAAGLVGAAMWWLGDALGGYAGPIAVVVVLLGLASLHVRAVEAAAGAPGQRQRRVDRYSQGLGQAGGGSMTQNLQYAVEAAWKVLARRAVGRRRATHDLRVRRALAGVGYRWRGRGGCRREAPPGGPGDRGGRASRSSWPGSPSGWPSSLRPVRQGGLVRPRVPDHRGQAGMRTRN